MTAERLSNHFEESEGKIVEPENPYDLLVESQDFDGVKPIIPGIVELPFQGARPDHEKIVTDLNGDPVLDSSGKPLREVVMGVPNFEVEGDHWEGFSPEHVLTVDSFLRKAASAGKRVAVRAKHGTIELAFGTFEGIKNLKEPTSKGRQLWRNVAPGARRILEAAESLREQIHADPQKYRGLLEKFPHIRLPK